MNMFASALIGTSVLVLGTSSALAQEMAPAPPPPYSEETAVTPAEVDASAYLRERLGISSAEASERLALQDAAIEWAGALAQSSPPGFVDIDIEHEPTFKVNVYFSREIAQAEIARLAPPKLRRYVKVKRVKSNAQELEQDIQSILKALDGRGIEYAIYNDLRTEKIVIELVDTERRKELMELIPPDLRSQIKIKKGQKTVDTGGIFSGNWYRTGGPPGGLCTAAWPLRTSRGQEGIITAAHCEPRNPYFPYVDSGVYLGEPYDKREGTSLYKTYDWAIYLLGPHYTAPVSYIDNNVTYNGYTNIVVGLPDGYYNISDTIRTASQIRGAFMCKNGSVTGLSCGEILSTSYSNPSRNEYGLIQVGNSFQPNIAVRGDSGGPVFTYPNGTELRAAGVLKSVSSFDGKNPCQNSQSCFFVYMPLAYAAEQEPFTVNTLAGFKTP